MALSLVSGLARVEVLIETADLQLFYGDYDQAARTLTEAGLCPLGHYAARWHLAASQLLLRQGNYEQAKRELRASPDNSPGTEPGLGARRRFIAAALMSAEGEENAAAEADRAASAAWAQGAHLWVQPAQLLTALPLAPFEMNQALGRVAKESPWAMSLVAELLCRRLGNLDESNLGTLLEEAALRPERWRTPLRQCIAESELSHRVAAGHLLDRIGDGTDVPRLRSLARSAKRVPGASVLGKRLARRIAKHVFIEDQGRVRVNVGDTTIQGTEIRRKVLALLCFLLTRLDLSATRDHVLDALWPDLEPNVAVNSLNQTVYFLRRVFEPEYMEDLSPGYIHHDSDVLWLDPELVTSRSRLCRQLLRQAALTTQPTDVMRLVEAYAGPFALDFAYEEWASAYRNSMHAAFLEVVERAIQRDTNGGNWDRAIAIARHASEADPEAESLEVALLRLYRLSGAHAAASEQYEHYAHALRVDLGVEPPPLASL